MATTSDCSQGIGCQQVGLKAWKWGGGGGEFQIRLAVLWMVGTFALVWLVCMFLGGTTTRFPTYAAKEVMSWANFEKCTEHGTLRTMWNAIRRPLLPGYFLVTLEADKLKRLAPVSVQMAWINIFFPTPAGPASNKAFTRGAFSWTVWEPVKSHRHYYCFHLSLP